MCQAVTAPKKARQKLKLNQTEYWSRVGVTQSAGSRYESGRSIPKPTATLLTIAYGTEKQRESALSGLVVQKG